MYKVVIADDRPYARLGLRMLLKSSDIYGIVGEASNGNEAVEVSEELLPDLLLTDLKMPGVSIIEGAKRLKNKIPHIKIVVLTAFDDCEDIYLAFKAGIDGYLMKDTDPEHILHAIQQVMNGSSVFQSKENVDFMEIRREIHEIQ
ncbi:DNA-binding NarL/FixJ family response regulator [Paenibacillus endophyticus]|uniref:DNA-binding NarL/FixJ family response regulator n=1 Tax=Paenibacillus endophyticus TaxID=1294268 RepID=A0A7W5GCX0_9BACL|nr:response regulator transcription factor [Paenibacillus endophyticus]MBB3155305.1 DNA-binding NarL/FixJ family response regulator [Paenibacillus endophyticus]